MVEVIVHAVREVEIQFMKIVGLIGVAGAAVWGHEKSVKIGEFFELRAGSTTSVGVIRAFSISLDL